MITEAYYTVENGMMVTVGFSNNLDTDEHISKVIVAIYNEKDAQLAKAQSESMSENFVVVAGGTNEVTMYIKPEYVSITDDPIETLRYDITIDHETVKWRHVYQVANAGRLPPFFAFRKNFSKNSQKAQKKCWQSEMWVVL